MLQTQSQKTAGSGSAPETVKDHLMDGLSDPLVTRGGPTKTTRDEVTSGPKPKDEREIIELSDGTPYIEYPEPTQTVRGTSKHSVDLNEWSDGSALVANSSSDTGYTNDQLSPYDAYAGYSDEHPEWSWEKRLTMASREDVNVGGDVVSAKHLPLSEIKEKGLVSEGGRRSGPMLNELLFKSFVNPHGWESKYGKGGAKKLLEERGG